MSSLHLLKCSTTAKETQVNTENKTRNLKYCKIILTTDNTGSVQIRTTESGQM